MQTTGFVAKSVIGDYPTTQYTSRKTGRVFIFTDGPVSSVVDTEGITISTDDRCKALELIELIDNN